MNGPWRYGENEFYLILNVCKEKILDRLPAFVYDTRGDSDE